MDADGESSHSPLFYDLLNRSSSFGESVTLAHPCSFMATAVFTRGPDRNPWSNHAVTDEAGVLSVTSGAKSSHCDGYPGREVA